MLSEQQQDYPHVVVNIRTHFRLIECRDHIQWILQRRDKNKERWRGISYFLFKKSMIRVFQEHGLDTDLLETLPEHFESRFKTVQSEQRRIHEAYSAARRKRARCQKFFNGLIADFN
jgi:hypothetical protein